MSRIFLLSTALLFSVLTKAQDSSFVELTTKTPLPDSVKLDKFSAGIGGGYEFGGIGGNIIWYPQRNIGIFGGLGYPLTGIGYNFGIKIRYAEDDYSRTFTPFLIGMYGYNTAIIYRSNPQFNKLFYNFTIGGGIDFRIPKSKLGYFSLTVYVPFRKPDAKDYITNYVDWFYGIGNSNKLFPLSASLGYKFVIFR